MIKKIFLFFLVFGTSGSFVSAQDYRTGQTAKSLQDKFSDFSYVVHSSSRCNACGTGLSGNVTFYGYATDIEVKVSSNTDPGIFNWWATFMGTTDTIKNGEKYQNWFYVPVDSPTIIGVQSPLPVGVTVQIKIGGLKRD